MKKFHSKNKLALTVALIVLSAAILAGKMLEDTPTRQPLPFDNLAGFPNANSMTVQLLRKPTKEGNILFTATYNPELVGDVKSFSVFINEPKSETKRQIVLHDDGENGDEKAGDFVFTATIQEDLRLFKAAMARAESDLRRAGGKIISFNGRYANVKQRPRLFDMAAFGRFEKVAIDRDIFDIPLADNVSAGTASNARLMEDQMFFDGNQIIDGDGGGGGEVVVTPLPPCNPIINRFKSLFITDISVTEDPVRTYNPCTNMGNPNGAWTFKTVMTNMANQPLTGVSPNTFVIEWLDTWMRGNPRLTPGTSNPVVNTQVLDSRVHPFNTSVQATTILHAVIKPWLQAASGNSTLVVDSLPTSPNYWKTVWQNLATGSGYTTGVDVLKFAPFKLSAFVNRVDLVSSNTTTTGGGYAGGGTTTTTLTNAGEGRLVYSIVKDPKSICGNAVSSLTQPFEGFNVIFEYGIPLTTCAQVVEYQNKWRNLSDLPFGSSYNAALEVVTNVFTAMNAAPAKQNGSALNQLRSNEIAITSLLGGTLPTPYAPGSDGSVPFWQLREFALNTGNPLLANATTKLEPMVKFNGASFAPLTSGNSLADIAILANFVNTNSAAIQAGNHTVPLVFSGVNFLAGRADVHSPSAASTPYHWDGRGAPGSSTFITNDNARFSFSLNTCSGCHGGETGTGFVHVRYIGFGHNITPTSTSPPFGLRDLSSFLTGLGPDADPSDDDNNPNGLFFVSDPAGRPAGAPSIRGFNDLLRRENVMKNLICNSCGSTGAVFSMVNVVNSNQVAQTH